MPLAPPPNPAPLHCSCTWPVLQKSPMRSTWHPGQQPAREMASPTLPLAPISVGHSQYEQSHLCCLEPTPLTHHTTGPPPPTHHTPGPPLPLPIIPPALPYVVLSLRPLPIIPPALPYVVLSLRPLPIIPPALPLPSQRFSPQTRNFSTTNTFMLTAARWRAQASVMKYRGSRWSYYERSGG